MLDEREGGGGGGGGEKEGDGWEGGREGANYAQGRAIPAVTLRHPTTTTTTTTTDGQSLGLTHSRRLVLHVRHCKVSGQPQIRERGQLAAAKSSSQSYSKFD